MLSSETARTEGCDNKDLSLADCISKHYIIKEKEVIVY